MQKPPHAAAIWADSTFVYLDLPSPVCDRTHQIKMPRTAEGLQRALEIIAERTKQSTLNRPGAPTQLQVYNGSRVQKAKLPPKRPKLELTAEQTEAAKSVIRRMMLP